MNPILFIYLANVIPFISGCIGILLFIFWGGILVVIVTMMTCSRTEKEFIASVNPYLKAIKTSAIITVITIFILSCIPSENTMYLMYGTYVIKHPGVPQPVIKIINDKLNIIASQS